MEAGGSNTDEARMSAPRCRPELNSAIADIEPRIVGVAHCMAASYRTPTPSKDPAAFSEKYGAG